MTEELKAVQIVDGDTALQRQTADFLQWERRRKSDAHRFYEKYEELRGRHKETGTNWSRDFDPVEHAAYTAWKSRDVGDIPLMPVE